MLDALIIDKLHSFIFSNFNSYAHPLFCLENDEPIDLITIKNKIFSKKYKKRRNNL